jgi:hypothetical protein
MKQKKTSEGIAKQGRKAARNNVRRQERAYGDNATICTNADCILRKKARCFGFEGCPGFKGM